METKIENLECGCKVIVVECVDGESIVLKKHCELHTPPMKDFDNKPATKDTKWKY